jgi:hypothetical protein
LRTQDQNYQHILAYFGFVEEINKIVTDEANSVSGIEKGRI